MRCSTYGVHACYGPSCCSSTTSSLCPEASGTAVAPRTCSVATEVNRQFLGQDFHLLDDDAFHGAPKRRPLLNRGNTRSGVPARSERCSLKRLAKALGGSAHPPLRLRAGLADAAHTLASRPWRQIVRHRGGFRMDFVLLARRGTAATPHANEARAGCARPPGSPAQEVACGGSGRRRRTVARCAVARGLGAEPESM